MENVKGQLNADTGEPGFQEEQSALAVVSSYDEHERPVQYSFREHAEYMLKSFVASGIRGTYTPASLDDKEFSVRENIRDLMCGGWADTLTLKSQSAPSGWICLHENGDRNATDRNYVVFLELPENSVLAQRLTPFVCIRINSQADDDGYPVALRTNSKGYLDTGSSISPALLDGVIHSYKSRSHAVRAMTELTEATAKLYWSHRERTKAQSDAEELELEASEREERRLATLARKEAAY